MACTFLLSAAQAQVRFYTQVSEANVSPKQTFQVQYIVEGTKEISHFSLPSFPDFHVEEVFDIPNTPTINQQTMQVVDTYLKIVILSPRRTGKFTIAGASAEIDGRFIKSNTVKITVQQTGLTALPPGNIDTEEESELRQGEDIEAKIKKNFFLRVEANKTICFVGEPLMVVYKVYSRLNSSSQVVRRPSLTGFSVLDMVDAYDGKAEVEVLNGLPFYTNIIRKVQLFPLQEGIFSLDAAEIESVIHFVKVDRPLDGDKEALRRVLTSPNDNNNANRTTRTKLDYRTSLRSDPLNITVKPLPAENQPPIFAGAVGNFSLAVQTPANAVRVGDLVKIKVLVNGSGNISLLTAPHIKWPRGVDTADPVVKETINKYVYPVTGSKSFEYSFAASDTGNIVIPQARLPYYDPVQKLYKIATSAPVTIHVAPEIKTGGNIVIPVENNGDPGSTRYLYWFGLVVLIIVGWLTWQALHLKKAKPATVKGASVPIVIAPKVSLVDETLFKAQWALERGKPQLFYHELEQAIWQIIAIKYNLPPSALNKYNALQHLRQTNLEPEIISNFSTVLDELEWALYTPDQTAHDMEQLLKKARVILESIERS